ncbi:hypothetical protein DJ77_02575 [Halorubrum ezzemoulense]|nr:hypothetical protein DJ77_02575 [Halorubrum ezzemoulense]
MVSPRRSTESHPPARRRDLLSPTPEKRVVELWFHVSDEWTTRPISSRGDAVLLPFRQRPEQPPSPVDASSSTRTVMCVIHEMLWFVVFVLHTER